MGMYTYTCIHIYHISIYIYTWYSVLYGYTCIVYCAGSLCYIFVCAGLQHAPVHLHGAAALQPGRSQAELPGVIVVIVITV